MPIGGLISGTIVLAAAAVGAAVGLLPIDLGALLVPGLAVVAATLRSPRVPLILFIFAIPYSTLTKVGSETYSITAIEGCVALVLLAWVARGIARRQLVIRGGPIILMLGLLLAAALLSTLTAEDFPAALKELIKLGEMLV